MLRVPETQHNRPTKLNAKEVRQSQGGRMSYFEQGLILGATMGLAMSIALGYFSYRGVRVYLSR